MAAECEASISGIDATQAAIGAAKNHSPDGERRCDRAHHRRSRLCVAGVLIAGRRGVERYDAVDGLASEMAGGIAGEFQDDVRTGNCVSPGDVYFQGGIGKGRATVARNRQRPSGHFEAAGNRRDSAADQRDMVSVWSSGCRVVDISSVQNYPIVGTFHRHIRRKIRGAGISLQVQGPLAANFPRTNHTAVDGLRRIVTDQPG
jgi:hypothetical protein